MFKAAFFDCDGVVIDTEGQYSSFWRGMGREYFPEIPNLESRIKGMTLVQIYDRYCPNDMALQSEITTALFDFEAYMNFDYISGFESFMAKIRNRGIKTALVTSSNLAKMAHVYKAHPEFKGLFDTILTSEDFDRSKPDPDCYLKAAACFELAPAECVGFEDSINGLKAVKAANMYCVGLATTNPCDVVAQYADIVVDNYYSKELSEFA